MFLGVTGMLTPMPYTDTERRKIADAVRKARIALELDKEPAARAAKVSSITWKRVEDADGVRDGSLSKILGSLGLPAADDVLNDSGNITVTPTPARIVLLSQVPTFDLLDELRNRVVSSDQPKPWPEVAGFTDRVNAMGAHGPVDDAEHGQ